jgi:hypothetical protein
MPSIDKLFNPLARFLHFSFCCCGLCCNDMTSPCLLLPSPSFLFLYQQSLAPVQSTVPGQESVISLPVCMDFDDLDIANRLTVAEEEAAQALLHIREFQAPVPVLIECQNSGMRQELNKLLQGWAGFLDKDRWHKFVHQPISFTTTHSSISLMTAFGRRIRPP